MSLPRLHGWRTLDAHRGHLGYATWIAADIVANPAVFRMGSGRADLLARVAKLESGAGITASEAS